MSSHTTIPLKRFGPAQANMRWRVDEVEALFALPFNDLLFRAQQVHRENFDPDAVALNPAFDQDRRLLRKIAATAPSLRDTTPDSNASACSRSTKFWPMRVPPRKRASRFCMGAAWRGPKDSDLEPVLEMVREVKSSASRPV